MKGVKMKVVDIMNTEPCVLHTEQNIKEAAQLFIDKNIDGVPVVDDNDTLLGFICKKHIFKVIISGTDPNSKVKELMKKEVITVRPDEDLDCVWELDVGIAPVVDNGRIIGMLSKSDMIVAYRNINNDISRELNIVIDSAYNAIISVNKEGNVVTFNEPAERLFEIKKDQVIAKTFTDIFPETTLPNILKTGVVQPFQKFKIRDKTVISNRTPIMVDGNVVGAVAVIQDISEFENVSLKLKNTQESKEEIEAIIDSSFDGIYVTNAKGKTLYINKAYTRITGISSEQVIGKNMKDLVKEKVFDQSVTLMVMERLEPVTIGQKVNTGKIILVTGTPIFKEEKLFRIVTNVRDITELNELKQEVEEAQKLSNYYKEELKRARIQGCEKYIIRSRKSKELLDLILRLGQVDSTVLIQGESGVGKEIIAELLHGNSVRKDKPLVRINCGAIPESLLESELFGYESGAFTGAKKGGKEGLFEIAQGGTIFLDEIGELPLVLQVKMLRTIQEREITKVGGISPIKVDVRIIAATNRDLWEMVKNKQFRKDLFYRLNVIPINVPPLRERKEEIPALAYHFVDIFNKKYQLNKRLHEESLKNLLEYEWPGNIRELENIIERAIVTSPENVIKIISFSDNCLEKDEIKKINREMHEPLYLKEAIEEFEKSLIIESLNKHKSTRKTAKALGVSQPTIVRKAAYYGISLKEK